jgi:hypothetical protein
MDQSNSCEVNIFSASWDIACVLWNLHVHYCIINILQEIGRHKLHLHRTDLPNHIIGYEIQILFIDNGSNRDIEIYIMVKTLFSMM